MVGPDRPTHEETDASRGIRQALSMLEPEVKYWAQHLGVNVGAQSFPAQAVGGPVIPINFLACVINQSVGHRHIDRDVVLDAIDRCIGAASFAKREFLKRLLNPFCWLVDLPVLIVGWPFHIMRRAGVPDTVVDGSGAKVVKAVMAGAVALAAGVWGAQESGSIRVSQRQLADAMT